MLSFSEACKANEKPTVTKIASNNFNQVSGLRILNHYKHPEITTNLAGNNQESSL